MFDYCPKIDKICTFATKQKNGTRCGIATGVDTWVSHLPKCWKKMTKYEQNKLKKGTYWG